MDASHKLQVRDREDVMKLPRRRFLHLAANAAVLSSVPRMARAKAYPSRPVRIIVGYAPGGGQDILARLIGQWLSDRLGQSFVIENRPGAGANIATEAVVHAPPDGYTLLTIGPAHAVNATLYDKLSFNFLRDIAPVASVTVNPSVLEVHPSVPATSVSEFIAFAKANPGRLNMASAGNGTIQHVSGELFKLLTGVNMVHVPYRGAGPALADLLGGQVQVMFDTLISSIPYIRAGNLRALAVTTAARQQLLPQLPTIGEFVSGYEASSMNGIGAPRGTPTDIVDKLNMEINAGLADPRLQAKFGDLGSVALMGSPADYGKLLADETAKWAKVVKFAGLRPD
jgi:tripartite-type tricarboxylate transporter receptor subunit TctC